MKIREKLLAGYLVVALFTAAVGGIGLYMVKDIRREHRQLSEEIMPVKAVLERIRFEGLRLLHSLTEYCLISFGSDAPDVLLSSEREIQGSIVILQNSIVDYAWRVEKFFPQEKEHLAQIRRSTNSLIRMSHEILEQLKKGDGAPALFSSYLRVEKEETEFLRVLQTALEQEAKEIEENEKGVDRTFAVARRDILLATGFTFFAAVAAGIIVAARFSRPLVRLQRAAEEIGRGVFEVPSVVASRDEIGALGNALVGMATTLKKSKEEIVAGRNYLDGIFSSLNDSLIVVAPDGRIRSINPATRKLLGYTEEELVGREMGEILDPVSVQAMLAGTMGGITRITSIEETYLGRDGRKVPVSISVAALRDHHDELGGMVCLAHDITERRRAEREIQRLAYFDQLTQLPNRTLFQDRLSHALAQAQRTGERVALFFFDLDRFKDVNDTLGHSSGDLLLQQMAARLESRTRKSDTLARLGGDEFVLVAEVEGEMEAAQIAGSLLELIGLPFDLDGREVVVSTCIGIVLYPEDGTTPDTLLKHADMAMYAAKAKGANQFEFFSAEMNLKLQERKGMEADLRRALKNGEFLLHYQPQFNLASGELVGVEALVRWKDPERGMIPPGVFIGFAEENGLINPLGEWVLRAACAQGKAWSDAGHRGIRLAVNLSGRQFARPDFIEMVDRVLAETEFDPTCLELELTESTLMASSSATVATLVDLKVRGIHLAVDDFGTGYSSLNYLKHFPINRLKIDRSFIRGLPGDRDNVAIVQAVLALAHSLNLAVVAEGVETQEEASFLRTGGCDEVQGFLFARPLPPEQLVTFFAGARGTHLAPATVRTLRSVPPPSA